MILVGVLVLLTVGLVYYFVSKRKSSTETYENQVTEPLAGDSKLVLFYAPWCGHCKTLMPAWDQLAQENKDVMMKVNCDEQPEVAEKHGIAGFPTIKFCRNGLHDANNTVTYDGDRTADAINEFLQKHL